MNYDLKLDNDILQEIYSDEDDSRLYHVKAQGGHRSFPGLIFFIMNQKNIKKLNSLLDFRVYKKHDYAERFFEAISNLLDFKKMDITTTDYIDYSSGEDKKMFNNSSSDEYSYFAGVDDPKNEDVCRYFFYDIKNQIDLKVGEDIIKISKGENKLIITNEKIQILEGGLYQEIPFIAKSKIQIIQLYDRK